MPTVEFKWHRKAVQIIIDGVRKGHLVRMKKGSPKWQVNMGLISDLTGDPNCEALIDQPLEVLQQRIAQHVGAA